MAGAFFSLQQVNHIYGRPFALVTSPLQLNGSSPFAMTTPNGIALNSVAPGL